MERSGGLLAQTPHRPPTPATVFSCQPSSWPCRSPHAHQAQLGMQAGRVQLSTMGPPLRPWEKQPPPQPRAGTPRHQSVNPSHLPSSVILLAILTHTVPRLVPQSRTTHGGPISRLSGLLPQLPTLPSCPPPNLLTPSGCWGPWGTLRPALCCPCRGGALSSPPPP